MKALKDATHLYKVERRAYHAERKEFRITEIQISSTQCIPWHSHSSVQDTFYVLEGAIELFLLEPEEKIRLEAHQIYAVAAKRPHLVTNPGESSATFLVLQGGGEYDNIQLTELQARQHV